MAEGQGNLWVELAAIGALSSCTKERVHTDTVYLRTVRN